MSAEILREAAEAIRFDMTDHTGPWCMLPDALAPAVADWLEATASEFDALGDPDLGDRQLGGRRTSGIIVARAYLGRES